MAGETAALQTSDNVRLDARVHVLSTVVGGAIVCHPHPLYGGDMDNPVVGAIVAACVAAGLATVRFDFRGVRASAGQHDKGRAERYDAIAAIERAEAHAPGKPIFVCGYSFGSVVGLSAARPSVIGWVGVAPPVTMLHKELAAATDPSPKLLLVPEHDQFTKVADLHRATAAWPDTSVTVVPMADHFLNGQLSFVRDQVSAFIAATLASDRT